MGNRIEDLRPLTRDERVPGVRREFETLSYIERQFDRRPLHYGFEGVRWIAFAIGAAHAGFDHTHQRARAANPAASAVPGGRVEYSLKPPGAFAPLVSMFKGSKCA